MASQVRDRLVLEMVDESGIAQSQESAKQALVLATGPAQRWAIRAPSVDPTWKRGYHLGGSAKFADGSDEFADGSDPPLMCPVCKLADPSLPDQTHFPGVELLIEAVDENGVKVGTTTAVRQEQLCSKYMRTFEYLRVTSSHLESL